MTDIGPSVEIRAHGTWVVPDPLPSDDQAADFPPSPAGMTPEVLANIWIEE